MTRKKWCLHIHLRWWSSCSAWCSGWHPSLSVHGLTIWLTFGFHVSATHLHDVGLNRPTLLFVEPDNFLRVTGTLSACPWPGRTMYNTSRTFQNPSGTIRSCGQQPLDHFAALDLLSIPAWRLARRISASYWVRFLSSVDRIFSTTARGFPEKRRRRRILPPQMRGWVFFKKSVKKCPSLFFLILTSSGNYFTISDKYFMGQLSCNNFSTKQTKNCQTNVQFSFLNFFTKLTEICGKKVLKC